MREGWAIDGVALALEQRQIDRLRLFQGNAFDLTLLYLPLSIRQRVR